MKAIAFIFTLILGVVILRPPFTQVNAQEAMNVCLKEDATSCSKMGCDMPEEQQKDCESNSCDARLCCLFGNFYLHPYSSISMASLLIPKPMMAIVNDNRISKSLAECWHPPEIN